MTRPRPGGYADRAALVRARRTSELVIEDVRLLIDEGQRMSTLRFTQVLGRVAVYVAQLGTALSEMERIRAKANDADG